MINMSDANVGVKNHVDDSWEIACSDDEKYDKAFAVDMKMAETYEKVAAGIIDLEWCAPFGYRPPTPDTTSQSQSSLVAPTLLPTPIQSQTAADDFEFDDFTQEKTENVPTPIRQVNRSAPRRKIASMDNVLHDLKRFQTKARPNRPVSDVTAGSTPDPGVLSGTDTTLSSPSTSHPVISSTPSSVAVDASHAINTPYASVTIEASHNVSAPYATGTTTAVDTAHNTSHIPSSVIGPVTDFNASSVPSASTLGASTTVVTPFSTGLKSSNVTPLMGGLPTVTTLGASTPSGTFAGSQNVITATGSQNITTTTGSQNLTTVAASQHITQASGSRHIASVAGAQKINTVAGSQNITQATGSRNISTATGSNNITTAGSQNITTAGSQNIATAASMAGRPISAPRPRLVTPAGAQLNTAPTLQQQPAPQQTSQQPSRPRLVPPLTASSAAPITRPSGSQPPPAGAIRGPTPHQRPTLQRPVTVSQASNVRMATGLRSPTLLNRLQSPRPRVVLTSPPSVPTPTIPVVAPVVSRPAVTNPVAAVSKPPAVGNTSATATTSKPNSSDTVQSTTTTPQAVHTLSGSDSSTAKPQAVTTKASTTASQVIKKMSPLSPKPPLSTLPKVTESIVRTTTESATTPATQPIATTTPDTQTLSEAKKATIEEQEVSGGSEGVPAEGRTPKSAVTSSTSVSATSTSSANKSEADVDGKETPPLDSSS